MQTALWTFKNQRRCVYVGGEGGGVHMFTYVLHVCVFVHVLLCLLGVA